MLVIFSSTESKVFVNGTWNLLLEQHRCLSFPNDLRISDCRKSLYAIDKFLGEINPKRIFRSYLNTPNQSDIKKKQDQAKINMAQSRYVLRAHLLKIALLESIAQQTGGDTALSLFLGDYCTNKEVFFELKQLCQKKFGKKNNQDNQNHDCSLQTYEILSAQPVFTSPHYILSSPLAKSLFETLSPVEFNQALKKANQFINQEISASSFFFSQNPQIQENYLSIVKTMSSIRHHEIEALFNKRLLSK